MILDLHGYTEEEAIPEILTAIFSWEEDEYIDLEIITGNGNVLKRVLEEILEEENISWSHKNNNYGSYILER